MKYLQAIKCFWGFHAWHYYDRYNGERAYAREMRKCKQCTAHESLRKIEVRHWE